MSQLELIQLWYEVSTWASREGEPKELDLAARKWLLDEMDWAYDPDHDAVVDGIRDRVTEDPLSVQVRSDWHDLGKLQRMLSSASCSALADQLSGSLEICMTSRCSPVVCSIRTGGHPGLIRSLSNPNQKQALQWYCDQFCWEDC